ncbi:hypothetical protein ACHAXS_000561 [Conticribra weissflogii]
MQSIQLASIFIQNASCHTTFYYLLSNNHVNKLIEALMSGMASCHMEDNSPVNHIAGQQGVGVDGRADHPIC